MLKQEKGSEEYNKNLRNYISIRELLLGTGNNALERSVSALDQMLGVPCIRHRELRRHPQ